MYFSVVSSYTACKLSKLKNVVFLTAMVSHFVNIEAPFAVVGAITMSNLFTLGV